MKGSYRSIIRSLNKVAPNQKRTAWNRRPSKNPIAVEKKAYKFALATARNAFADHSYSSTIPTNQLPSSTLDSSLQFLNSCQDTTISSRNNRTAILNTARIMDSYKPRVLKKRLKTLQKGKVSQKNNNIQFAKTSQKFLTQQIGLINPYAGAHFLARTSSSLSFSSSSLQTSSFSTIATSSSSFSTASTTSTITKPYQAFGTPSSKHSDDDEYEIVDEVWEVRTYTATGREYIYNRTTHEIRPAEEAITTNNETSDEILSEYIPPMVTIRRKDNDEEEERELRWEEHAEIRGDRLPYFLNRANGETTWKFPFEDPEVVPEFPPMIGHQFMKIENLQELSYAPISKRLGAAALDFAIVVGATGAYSCVMYYEMGPKCLPGVAILLFVAYSWRDAVLEQGSRSLGKKYFNLEIVKKDGTLPGRYETVGRSFYFISYYGLVAIGVFEMPELLYVAAGLLVTDVGLMVADGRRIGDFLFGTKVIQVQELRDERVKDRTDYLVAESNAA